MTYVPSLEEEARKFDLLNRPASSAFRLAHAVRLNNADPFDPAKMLAAMDDTIDRHMADHIGAVKRITGQTRTGKPETP